MLDQAAASLKDSGDRVGVVGQGRHDLGEQQAEGGPPGARRDRGEPHGRAARVGRATVSAL